MINLESLTDNELHRSGMNAVRAEADAGVTTMAHIIEVNRRHLYSKFNCSSLYDYCVNHWKMTNGDAWRKISAARLVNEQPELELKLEDGSLTQTHLAEAAAFFKRESFTPEEKIETLKELENTSTAKAKDILFSKSRAPEKHLKERLKKRTSNVTEVTLYLDEETVAAINRLKEIWSHAIPSCEIGKIVTRALNEAVEKHDPIKKDERAQKRKRKPTATTKPFAVTTPAPGWTAEVARKIRTRDCYQCTYKNPSTGERCPSKHFIEIDHIIPKAQGGTETVENGRLVCRTHNQRYAINIYGFRKMRSFLRTRSEIYVA